MSSTELQDVPVWKSCRVLVAVLAFFGTVNLYSLRANMSIAIVCMVKPSNSTTVSDNFNTTSPVKLYPECSANSINSTDLSKNNFEGEFEWDRSVQGQILSSFFFGYLFLQIPAGLLAQKFGPKRVISALMGLAVISTLAIPLMARVHWIAVVVLRVMLGLGSGVMFPGLHQLWANWAPPLERSKLVGFSYAGAQIGTIITLPLSSVLCERVGWESVFYFFGACGCVWLVMWIIFIYDSPELHPRITESEKNYIQTSLEGQVSKEGEHSIRLPIKDVFLSLPFWAIIVANVTYDWGGYTFLTNLPTYIKDVLNFSLVANGFVSSVPYIGFYVFQIFFAWLADFVQVRQCLSTKNTRKLMTSLGMAVPGTIVIFLGYLNCTQWLLAVILLTVGISFKGAGFSGMLVNHVDIAPRYAGVLFGISNAVAAVTGYVAPNVVTAIVKTGSQHEWRIVFFITSVIYIFGTVFYLIFAKGKLQSWAHISTSSKDIELSDKENLEVTEKMLSNDDKSEKA